jgi:DNA-binding transcriptional LysR family regulator
VGVQLLERTSRSVRLTAAGAVLYREAEALLRRAQDAASAAARTGKGEAGRVVIGFTAVSGYAMIPSLLAAATAQHPDIAIVLEEMVSGEQMRALDEGLIDLAFVRPMAAGAGLGWHRLAREPMLLAIPAAHPLAARDKPRLADLDGEPLVMYSEKEGKYFFDKVMALFSARAVQPRFVQHLGQTHSIVALVRAGIGLAIVPASARHLHFDGVVFRPLWRRDVVAETYLAWRDDPLNPAQRTIREFILSAWKPPLGDDPR